MSRRKKVGAATICPSENFTDEKNFKSKSSFFFLQINLFIFRLPTKPLRRNGAKFELSQKYGPKIKFFKFLVWEFYVELRLGHYLKTNRQREKLVSEEAIGWFAWSRGATK